MDFLGREPMGWFETMLHKVLKYLRADRGPNIVVDGIKFRRVVRTLCGTNSVGVAPGHIIKIEHSPNPRKLRNLQGEAEIIAELNRKGCVSCPRLISKGALPNGEPYLVLERIICKGTPRVADMLLSLIEQKNFGVYQGDFKPANMVFDGSVCFLVDYDQAQEIAAFAKMGNVEFIEWIARDFRIRRSQDFFTQEDRQFSKPEFLSHFQGDSFNMTRTNMLAKQMATNTNSGVYHKLSFPQIYTEGSRDLSHRLPLLDQIAFKPGETVLDVGCNLGLLSHYLCDRGCSVTGIDMDPNIVRAARVVANIVGKPIDFRVLDMVSIALDRQFDTVCLFSVLHHIKNMDHVTKYISRRCHRVILENGICEAGSVPVKGKWKPTNVWRFDSVAELVTYVQKMLPGFELEKVWGQGDRDRYIITFLRAKGDPWQRIPEETYGHDKGVHDHKHPQLAPLEGSKEPTLQRGPRQAEHPGDKVAQCLRRERYDCLLIWGHGIPYKEEIVSIIGNTEFVKILRIMNYRPKSIRKFVRAVYSYDYAPFEHLKSKTRYLLKTGPDVVLVFVHNEDAQEIYSGERAFRHIECRRIKSIKEEIRNRFNPREDGSRTEDHVVHASDNESQVHHILKHLGFKDGIALLKRTPNPTVSLPYYIPEFKEFSIRHVNSSQVHCSILMGTRESFWKEVVPIEETPHFACLTGNVTPYKEYLSRFMGAPLTCDYSVENLMKLSQNLAYLEPPYATSYILVKEFERNRYLIWDGVHRASILKSRGVGTFAAAVVE